MTAEPNGVGTSEAKRGLFDQAVEEVGSIAVAHLRINYPAAFEAVPKTAQISLRNAVRAAARARFLPLVEFGSDADDQFADRRRE